jgi:hypothetical protein
MNSHRIPPCCLWNVNRSALSDLREAVVLRWLFRWRSLPLLLLPCIASIVLWAGSLSHAAVLDVMDGLAMRLESIDGVLADDTSHVSDWTDLTGNGFNASQYANTDRRPLYVPAALPSGAPVIRFDGQNDLLTLAGQVITNQDFSVFAVVNATPANGGNQNLFGNWSGAAGNFGSSVFLGLTGYQADTDSARVRFTDTFPSAGTVRPALPHFLLDFVTDYDPTGPGSTVVSFKGIPIFSGGDLGERNLSSNPDNAPYTIGAQGDPDHGWTAGEYWTGDIAALLVYNRTLTAAEQTSVRLYLQNTYLEPVAPTLESFSPPADAVVAGLQALTLVFDEAVQNVKASDLLLNGAAVATSVTVVSAREYTFHFPQAAVGPVTVSFAADNGITDLATPPNAFAGATWNYTVVLDATPPTVASTEPPAGATVSGLSFITVVFDEDVTGVDARDLLVNGAAIATNLVVSSPRVYTFVFPEPAFGPVTVAFASANGITDLAPIPNPFAGASWSYTLDASAPLTLVPLYGLGLRLEATSGVSADDAGNVTLWTDESGSGHDAFQDRPGRNPILVPGATATGAPAVRFDGGSALLDLTGQVLTSQDFSIFAVVNATPTSSGNKNLFGNWAIVNMGNSVFVGLTGYQAPTDSATARFTDAHASAGTLANVAQHFLLEFATDNDPNGPGSSTVADNGTTIFSSDDLDAGGGRNLSSNPATDPYTIGVQGDPDHGGSAGEYWQGDVAAMLVYNRTLAPVEVAQVRQYLMATYVSQDMTPPTLVAEVPPADVTTKSLGSITVVFDEDVQGVDAGDLLINNAAIATNLIALSARQYTFQFPQPAPGPVSVAFAANAGITDLSYARNAFAGASFGYTLDPTVQPALIADGLVMQLESIAGVTADANGLVSGWADQTPNAHNAFQANPDRQPSLVAGASPSGAPVLRFDGSSDLLTLEGQVVSSQSFSIFAVVNAVPRDAGNKNLFGNWSSAAGNFTTSVFTGLTGFQAAQDSAIVRFTDGAASAGTATSLSNHCVLAFVTANDPSLPIWTVVSQNDIPTYIGGGIPARNLSSNPDTAPYTIGVQGDPDHGGTAGEYWTGDIAALLVYDRALEPAEQFAVWEYLDYTYLVPSVSPTLTIQRVTLPGGPGVRISWPQAAGSGFKVQSTTSLPATTWVSLPPATLEGNEYVVTDLLTTTPGGKFYALFKQ